LVSNQRETRGGTKQNRQERNRNISPARRDKTESRDQEGTLRGPTSARVTGGAYIPQTASTAQHLPPTPIGVHLCPSPSLFSSQDRVFDTLYSAVPTVLAQRPFSPVPRPPAPDQASDPASTYPHVAQRDEQGQRSPQQASHTLTQTHTRTHMGHQHQHQNQLTSHQAHQDHQVPDRPARRKTRYARYTSRCTRPSTRREYCTYMRSSACVSRTRRGMDG
jgi:hypothetical protein